MRDRGDIKKSTLRSALLLFLKNEETVLFTKLNIKTKRSPVFQGNTTTLYWCTARSVDKERRVRFLVFTL